MEQLIKFILATAGLTWILCDSTIFKPLREWITITQVKHPNIFFSFLRQIFKCNGCMGFWAGMICYVLVYKNIGIDVQPTVYALCGSFCGYCLVAMAKFFERKF